MLYRDMGAECEHPEIGSSLGLGLFLCPEAVTKRKRNHSLCPCFPTNDFFSIPDCRFRSYDAFPDLMKKIFIHVR